MLVDATHDSESDSESAGMIGGNFIELSVYTDVSTRREESPSPSTSGVTHSSDSDSDEMIGDDFDAERSVYTSDAVAPRGTAF